MEEEIKNENEEESTVSETHAGDRPSREPLLGTLLLLSMILFVVASLGGVFYAAYSSWHVSKEQKNRLSIASLSSEPATQADEETKSIETPQSKDTPTAVADTQALLTKAQGTMVSTLNGGGVKGSAVGVADLLKKAGYLKVTPGNAIGNYTGIVIYFATGLDKEAQTLKTTLSGKYPAVTMQPALPSNKETTTAPLTVIIGK